MRALVVNADDFGFTRDVNSGIVQSHLQGILTATTLMANGAAFDDAVALAKQTPTLDIGVHLQMVQGQSLSHPGRPLPSTPTALIAALSLGRWNVFEELRAQVEKILATGILPTHLDTHKHTHLLPPVLDAVARLSQIYKIPWIRRPFDFPLTGARPPLAALAMRAMRGRFERVLARYGALATDHFAGFAITGNYSAAQLIHLIANLLPGSTELMAHPGHLGPELLAAQTRLKQSRVQELQVLIDPSVRQALATHNVQLGGYRMLNLMRQHNPERRP